MCLSRTIEETMPVLRLTSEFAELSSLSTYTHTRRTHKMYHTKFIPFLIKLEILL